MGDGEMPREKVYDTTSTFDVDVAWGKDCSYVQVAVVAAKRDSKDVPTQRIIDIVNEWLTAAGEPAIDLAKLREKLPDEPNFDGWHATLNTREQLNELIRHLRRARDGAFGKDE